MIKIGDWLNDYKTKLTYKVIETGTADGKTVVLCETHTTKNSPVIGYDVMILANGDLIPDGEKWGETAWSWITLEQAKKAFAAVSVGEKTIG